MGLYDIPTQGAIATGLARGQTSTPTVDYAGVTLDDEGADTGGPEMVPTGGSSQSSSSQQWTPVLPPVQDLLEEMRLRRAQQHTVAANIVAALMQAAPMAVPEGSGGVFPGFEPGGVADVLMGIITGQGTKAGGNIISGLRQPGTMTLPISAMNVPEPSVGSEFAGALGMAKQILDAMKVIQTGTSASGGSSWSQAPLETQEASAEDIVAALLVPMLMQALGGGTSGTAGIGGVPGVNMTPAYGINPETGQVWLGGEGVQ